MNGVPGRAHTPGGNNGQTRTTGTPSRTSESVGWAISGYLLGGIIVYGGIGWLIGHWAGHQPAFMAAGVIVGVALALTLTILRHGRG